MDKHRFKRGDLKNITFCCKDCGNKIGYDSAIYGEGRCQSCRVKDKENDIQIKNITFCCKDCGGLIKRNSALRGNGKCASCSHKGKKHLKEHKLKIGLSNKGRKLSKETCLKLSLAKKGKNNPMFGKIGKSCPNWNPYLTNEEREFGRMNHKNIQWRYNVYKKDNFTCQCCDDNKGHNLIAHHLEGYHWCKELRFETNNGITLCEDCHKSFHNQFGNRYNTKEQFYQFQKELKNG